MMDWGYREKANIACQLAVLHMITPADQREYFHQLANGRYDVRTDSITLVDAEGHTIKRFDAQPAWQCLELLDAMGFSMNPAFLRK